MRLLAMVGIVVAIGATLARSVWFFTVGPQPTAITTLPAPAPAPAAFDIDAIAGANLFGDPAKAERRMAQAELDDTPDTRLNLELAAVYQADDPQQSLAIIGAGERGQEAYRIGDTLPGNARLVAIHRGQVVISRDGIRERLRFDEPSAAALSLVEPAAGSGATARAPRPPPVAPLPPRQGAVSSPPQARQVARAYRERLAAAPENALDAIGVTPVSATDARGYRVGALADAPQLAHTGLQTGDVILSVNGRPVGNFGQDRARLDAAMAAGTVRLEIQRGGRRFFVSALMP